MGVAQAGLRLNAWCSLGILAVIGAIGVGLPAVDRAVPSLLALTPGAPYRVADRVTVVPPPGARLDLRETRPGQEAGRALFHVGGVRYAVVVTTDRIDVGTAATRLVTRLRDSAGARPVDGEATLPPGLAPETTRVGRFRTGATDGWYAVRVLGPRTVVDVTATGAPGDLAGRLPDILASTASIGPRS
jgi:hypothetical protein